VAEGCDGGGRGRGMEGRRAGQRDVKKVGVISSVRSDIPPSKAAAIREKLEPAMTMYHASGARNSAPLADGEWESPHMI